MYHLDDLTPEEMEPQNQPIINFLRRSYERKHLTSIQQQGIPENTEQATARVRQRLQTVLQSDQGAQLSSGILFPPQDHKSTVKPMRRQWKNYMSLLAIAAILTLVIGSTLFVFQQVQTNPALQSLRPFADQAHTLIEKLRTRAEQWGETHMYHNTYDGKQYPYNSSYLQATMDLEENLAAARLESDFKAVIQDANTLLFLQQQFEANFADTTPFIRVHTSDQEILTHFQLTDDVIIIVSTAEQSIRIYQDSELVKAFLVTIGKPEMPTPAGIWYIDARITNTGLKSTDPDDSPKWYPATKVNYMLPFHSWDYALYDSWWRADHGPGTQFPRIDSGGNTTYAYNSNSGGVEMAMENAKWLYEQVEINTPVIIY